jgi:T-complex protein 1 subunit eta
MNTYDAFVWEPTLVKLNALSAATEAACTILSIDETVRNPKSEKPNAGPRMPGMGGRGRGPGMGGLAKNMKLAK